MNANNTYSLTPHYIRRYSTKAEAEFAGRENGKAFAKELPFVDSLGNFYTRWVSGVKDGKHIKTLRTNGNWE